MKKRIFYGVAAALAVSGALAAGPGASYGAVITAGAGQTVTQVPAGPGAAEAGRAGQATAVQAEAPTLTGQPESAAARPSFDAAAFVLPEEARVLVVVEGTGGSQCRVYAYEKQPDGWMQVLSTPGVLGANGMSSHRVEGDKTTPIGVFQMNTPFGQKEALEGFPSNYIQVNKNHVWSDRTNKLVEDPSAEGEHVGSAGYTGYYDYVIDAGFNPLGLEKQGSALFLHCSGDYKASTSGCVAIDPEQMLAVMRLYGTYGDGACYIAQAPEGTFGQIYGSYGTNQGLSPEGNF